MRGRITNLVGFRSGMLIAIKMNGVIKTRATWVCKCDCGSYRIVPSQELIRGTATSCGCRKYQHRIKHGQSRHRLYDLWCSMFKRCYDKSATNYKYYGARGITVCDEWRDINVFLSDMEASYVEGLTLDRINNEKGYCKENCRWATTSEQNLNRRRWVRRWHKKPTQCGDAP